MREPTLGIVAISKWYSLVLREPTTRLGTEILRLRCGMSIAGAGRFGLLQVKPKRDEVIVLRCGITHDDGVTGR